MRAYTYIEHGKFGLSDKPVPELTGPRDAVVRVTLCSICTSDLHIKHGSRRGYVNNCTDPEGGWALGCRIDGGQAEYVRVPYADRGLNRIPDTVSDEQALFVGDLLATGFWAARISEITEGDTVLVIGAGPTGLCTLLCVMLKRPKRVIVCENSPERARFVKEHYPGVLVTGSEECRDFVLRHSDHGGADAVLEVAGGTDTFRLAWECARPNAVVTVVALYDRPQLLPLPEMYGKNLTFKTGGENRHNAAHYPSLPVEPYRRGIPSFRGEGRRCNQDSGRLR